MIKVHGQGLATGALSLLSSFLRMVGIVEDKEHEPKTPRPAESGSRADLYCLIKPNFAKPVLITVHILDAVMPDQMSV